VTLYAKRDIKRLDEEGGYYQRHVSAMTTESLHFKSDIAAELAWRDWEYAKCAAQLDQAKAEIERLKASVEQREQALTESLAAAATEAAKELRGG
jgi:NAD dependent epimerase/dehydratase family enzyme